MIFMIALFEYLDLKQVLLPDFVAKRLHRIPNADPTDVDVCKLADSQHGRRQDFLCRGQSGGKAEGLGGKEKSIHLNIKRVRKLKY